MGLDTLVGYLGYHGLNVVGSLTQGHIGWIWEFGGLQYQMPKQYHNPGAESEGDPSGLPQRKARALGGPPHMKPTLEDANVAC